MDTSTISGYIGDKELKDKGKKKCTLVVFEQSNK